MYIRCRSRRASLLGAAILICAASFSPCRAGPCTREIDHLQARADAAIEAHARAGPFGSESIIATDSLQPTPESLARSERKLSGWTGGVRAVKALRRAREADRNGDLEACEHALRAARHALRPAART
jgi:hypothetical protein